MENRYNYRAFVNDNFDLRDRCRYKENSLLLQLGAPSISFCSDHVDFHFYHQEREGPSQVSGGPKNRRRSISYSFNLSISSQGVRLSHFTGIRPKNRREEYEMRMMEKIVNTATAFMVELGKYSQ